MVERRDVEAAVAARKELGPDYETQILDSLVEKIERRLDERPRTRPPEGPPHRDADLRVVLGSLAIGVAVTAIATGNHQGWVAVIAWLAIVLVNRSYARRR